MAFLQRDFSLMKVMASPARKKSGYEKRKDIEISYFEEKYGCCRE